MSNSDVIKDNLRVQSAITAIETAMQKVESCAYGINALTGTSQREYMRKLHADLVRALERNAR